MTEPSRSDIEAKRRSAAGGPSADSIAIAPDLLEILVCPLTRSKLRQDGLELVAEVGGLRYPIRDGIPIMLIDEAVMPQGVANLDAFKEKYKDQIPE